MQAVVKKLHTDIDVNISGKGLKDFLKLIKDNIAGIQIVEEEDDDDEYVNVENTDWYKSIELTPAKVLKIRMENADMTFAELAKKSGIAAPNLALMESGKRNIGARTTKKTCGSLKLRRRRLHNLAFLC